jgi:hypothetical protein
VDDKFYNRVGGDRITSRQVDELIGLARGLAADGTINEAEVEFLQKWLAANAAISDQPVIRTLYRRVNEILADGFLDADEHSELLDTLNSFSNRDFELGEVLKPTTLPLCDPAPNLTFAGRLYCFTGTFNYGQRKHCEQAIADRGGASGGAYPKDRGASRWSLRDGILETLIVRKQDTEGVRMEGRRGTYIDRR